MRFDGLAITLEHLWAPKTGVTSASVMALAKTSRPVQYLGLAFNELDRAGLRALGASQSLTALRELDVRGRYQQHEFLTDGLPALRKLRVTRPTKSARQHYASRKISLY